MTDNDFISVSLILRTVGQGGNYDWLVTDEKDFFLFPHAIFSVETVG